MDSKLTLSQQKKVFAYNKALPLPTTIQIDFSLKNIRSLSYQDQKLLVNCYVFVLQLLQLQNTQLTW